jgi:adenylate kinase
MGKIASGKGTQAHYILEEFGGTLYSNGNLVREASTKETGFGVRLKKTYESGKLIPEWIASYWMTHALVAEHATEKIVFEAVAKKPHEAELFHEIHTWMDRPYVVFHINITDDEVKERSNKRARDIVDSPKSVEKRLEEYNTYTTASIEIFRSKGTLIEIDGSKTQEEVRDQIFNYLKAK